TAGKVTSLPWSSVGSRPRSPSARASAIRAARGSRSARAGSGSRRPIVSPTTVSAATPVAARSRAANRDPRESVSWILSRLRRLTGPVCIAAVLPGSRRPDPICGRSRDAVELPSAPEHGREGGELARLPQGLFHLRRGIAVGDDPSPGKIVPPVAADGEHPDRHRQAQGAVVTEPAEGASVQAPTLRLQLGDELQIGRASCRESGA